MKASLLFMFTISCLFAQEFPSAGPSATLPQEVPLGPADAPGVLPSHLPPTVPEETSRPGDSSERLESGVPLARPSAARELRLRLNEPVSLSLEGGSWIYTGGAQAGLGNLQRESTPEATRFRLVPRVAGIYQLDFQKQDAVTGGIQTQYYRLIVSGDVPVRNGTPAARLTGTGNLQEILTSAERLVSSGRHRDALIILRPVSLSGDPNVLRLLAQAAEAEGFHRESLEYWETLLSLISNEEKLPVYRDALRLALRAKEDGKALTFWGKAFVEEWEGAVFPWEDAQLLSLAELFLDARHHVAAGEVLQLWRERHPDTRQPDKGYFLQARLEERPDGNRREALRLYTMVADAYRLSPYALLAMEKAADLRRTYFRIR